MGTSNQDSSGLTLCVSKEETRELGAAGPRQSISPQLLSHSIESCSCPTHSTLKAPEHLLNSHISTFLLNHNRLFKEE